MQFEYARGLHALPGNHLVPINPNEERHPLDMEKQGHPQRRPSHHRSRAHRRVKAHTETTFEDREPTDHGARAPRSLKDQRPSWQAALSGLPGSSTEVYDDDLIERARPPRHIRRMKAMEDDE